MRLINRSIAAAVCIALLSSSSLAGTIKVFPDLGNTPIADAVAQLQDGDRLLLHAGTYDERIVLANLTKLKVLGKGTVLLDGAGPGASVSVTNCEKVRIQGLTIRNAPTQGVLVNASTNVVVIKCTIEQHNDQGVQVSGSEDVRILKCTVTGGRTGVTVTGASVATVRSNTLSGQSEQAILLSQISLPGNRVSRNTISNSALMGIELSGSGTKVDKNKLTDCTFGILSPLTGANLSESTVLRNKIVRGLVAIRVYISGGLSITGNVIEQPTAAAIQVAGSSVGTVVSKNRIVGSMFGIDDEGTDTLVSRNKAIQTTGFGYRARGSAGTFEHNTVKNTEGDGFNVWTAGNTFNRNRATGNAGFDLDSPGVSEGDNTFFKNVFGTVNFF